MLDIVKPLCKLQRLCPGFAERGNFRVGDKYQGRTERGMQLHLEARVAIDGSPKGADRPLHAAAAFLQQRRVDA